MKSFRILQFDSALMKYEPHGRFRYAGRYTFGGIELLVPPPDYPEMGYHIYMTGSACRAFEIYLNAQHRTWYDFFSVCLTQGGSFSRLDIAIDDTKPYFTITALDAKIKAGECLSKFRKRNYYEGSTIKGDPTGKTLNLGSRESLCFMVFYEKGYEQSQKTGKDVSEYGDWNRYEIRLRQELATQCVHELAQQKDMRKIGLELINTYIRVLDRKSDDSNRSRWPTWQPWAEFIAGLGRLQLVMKPAPRTLEQKKQWIAAYVAPTLKMIQLADDNLYETTIKDLIDHTVLKPQQMRLVEDYLIGRAALERTTQNESKS